jgi:hypothetical protein
MDSNPKLDSIAQDFVDRAYEYFLEHPEVLRAGQEVLIAAGRDMRLKRERLEREAAEALKAQKAATTPEPDPIIPTPGPILWALYEEEAASTTISFFADVLANALFLMPSTPSHQQAEAYVSHICTSVPFGDRQSSVIIAAVTPYRVARFCSERDAICERVREAALRHIAEGNAPLDLDANESS